MSVGYDQKIQINKGNVMTTLTEDTGNFSGTLYRNLLFT